MARARIYKGGAKIRRRGWAAWKAGAWHIAQPNTHKLKNKKSRLAEDPQDAELAEDPQDAECSTWNIFVLSALALHSHPISTAKTAKTSGAAKTPC